MTSFLNYNSFVSKVESLNNKYWNNSFRERWEYFEKVIDILRIINPVKALEIGAMHIALMRFSDNMDLSAERIDTENLTNKTFIQDAKILPWPIENKFYDVIVALQVFEHLSPLQPDIFAEIKRCSQNCILSIPYKWNVPDDPDHHNIDDDKIALWTNKTKPFQQMIIRNRIILYYKF